jgi:hypothetical protein
MLALHKSLRLLRFLRNDIVSIYTLTTMSLRGTKQIYVGSQEAIAITSIPYQGLPIIVNADQ